VSKKFPVKIQGDSCCFDFAESEFDNQIAQTPTNAKGWGLNLINYVCNKQVIYWFFIVQLIHTNYYKLLNG